MKANETCALRDLQATVRPELPKEAFRAQPWRALWALPYLALIVVGTHAIMTGSFPWYGSLAVGVVVGAAYTSLGFLGHEILHGSVVRGRRLQETLGYLCFGVFCVSPKLWRVWHNQVHHQHANEGDLDPDSFGTLDRYRKVPSMRLATVIDLAPGSRKLWSFFFLFYWFSFHGQLVLWVHSRNRRLFRGLNRRRAMLDSLSMIVFWAGLGIWAGPTGALLGLVIPMLVANFVAIAYISTNHLLRPQGGDHNPLRDSMSLTVPSWVDALHFHFSHHVEHHLFPALNSRFAPLVRASLLRHAADEYVAPPHWKALWLLYATPRLYLNGRTLVDPRTRQTVRVDDVEACIRSQVLKAPVRQDPRPVLNHLREEIPLRNVPSEMNPIENRDGVDESTSAPVASHR